VNHQRFVDFQPVQAFPDFGVIVPCVKNERPRRKRRGIKPVEAVPKALLESLLFFTINFNWAFGTAPIEMGIDNR